MVACMTKVPGATASVTTSEWLHALLSRSSAAAAAPVVLDEALRAASLR
jgi:hypothetical protein